MVKKLISITVVGGVAVLSACFGDAPEPTAPAKVTNLFTAQPSQHCSAGTYIGPVAIGSNQGYVTFLPYQPASNCGNNGGNGGQIQAAQDVFAFEFAVPGAPSKVGSAGMTDAGGHVQVAAKDINAVWAYEQMGTNKVIVDPGGAMVGAGQGGVTLAMGIAVSGSDVFVGTASNASTTGGREVNDPSYPSGGEGGINAGSGEIYKSGATFMTWNPSCAGLDRCIVANATTLAIGERVDQTNDSQISMIDAATATRTKVYAVTTGDTPHGLDIDDRYIAWSTALSCPSGNTSGNCRVSDCGVFVYDMTDASAKPIPLLSTSAFACIDAKLSNGYVYFTIVDVYSDFQQLFAPGIGRVKIADRTLETLDLGIRTPGAGPRRIFPIGDQLLLVDPLVMAKIDASALDGKLDFKP